MVAHAEKDTHVVDQNPIVIESLGALPGMTIVALALIALAGGIGITAIGPGGVLLTIGLFLLTDLSPAEVAGTAIVTHIATGILGSLAYRRSGHLAEAGTRALAGRLGIAALAATPLGVLLNTRLPDAVFGMLLAGLVVIIGLSVLARERFAPEHRLARADDATPQLAFGGVVAFISSIFGVGGPLLAVPALVLAGVPVLPALAAAQVQSIVIATSGAAAYLVAGTIDWPLAVLVGVPQLAGVLIGWRIARAVPRRPLVIGLAVALVVLGPVIALMA